MPNGLNYETLRTSVLLRTKRRRPSPDEEIDLCTSTYSHIPDIFVQTSNADSEGCCKKIPRQNICLYERRSSGDSERQLIQRAMENFII
jgi:hypothetical protein